MDFPIYYAIFKREKTQLVQETAQHYYKMQARGGKLANITLGVASPQCRPAFYLDLNIEGVRVRSRLWWKPGSDLGRLRKNDNTG